MSRVIVLTAATPWEAGPLARRWSLKPSEPGQFDGRLGETRVKLVQTGVGRDKTTRALSPIDASGELIAVSSGLCGALQPGVKVGDIAADLRGVPLEAVEAARVTAKELGLGFHAGIFHTSDRVESRPDAKRELGSRLRALAVDMESDAVREWCAERGGQFFGIRAVLDEVDDRLPEEPLEETSAGAALRYALRHAAELPLLLRLAARQRRAMGGLVEFLDLWLRRLPRAEEARH